MVNVALRKAFPYWVPNYWLMLRTFQLVSVENEARKHQLIINVMLMQTISHKAPLFIYFLLLTGVAYSQSSTSEDTTVKVIICESTLTYPREAQENNISGTVIVVFDVDSSCRIINIRIEKSIGYGCDKEAINALKKCKPKFNGAIRKCTAMFNLKQPFTFRTPEVD